MRSAVALVLTMCVSAPSVPLIAEDSAGPLARSAMRLAAEAAATSAAGRADSSEAPRPLELKWAELAPVIAGHVIELIAPGGARVRGEVVAVRDDALVLDVSHSSDGNVYPKGSASIPRASVKELTVERSRGSAGKNLGTIIGVIAGVIAGGYIAGTTADSAGVGIPLFIGLASAFTVAGYYVGKSGDKKTTAIHVVP
jgi:hypothetical protein